ncbi:MAG TPA: hypothetical protein VNT75_12605 [Symbiobacteriaceae bacterium]|nr:hypothetical protein [Symbiobacteriaceae bacterium]
MKRALVAATFALVLLAAVWVTGPYLFQGDAVYAVEPRPDGSRELVLRVSHPGLFVDMLPAPDGSYVQGGNLTPWPGSNRRRFVTLFRGPLQYVLSTGQGPFDLSNLPRPAHGGEPSLDLPTGWSKAGHYVGAFELVEGAPVTVALPAGIDGKDEAADKVRRLYAAAETLLGRPPVREKLAVVAGTKPEHLAMAVSELWVPDYGADAAWLETGATQFYAVKLLDQLKLWQSKERDQWLKVNQPEKPYALTIWLDASLRLNSQKKVSLNDLLVQGAPGQTEEEVVVLVNNLGGLAVKDHLERMLQGKDPLPVTR